SVRAAPARQARSRARTPCASRRDEPGEDARMSSPTRVLFLEVDAGDRELVRRWAGDGTLPTFGRLFGQALVGESESVDALFVGATWPSLYTGTNPARHGIHSLVQLRP